MTQFDNMSPEAMAAWGALTQAYGPLSVNSAYRDPEHNARVGGAKGSQHMHGNAFDIDVANLSREQRLALIEQARAAGFRGIGVYDNSLHFDVGADRAWGSDYTRNSLPEWAGGAVGVPVGQNALQQAPQGPENALTHYSRPQIQPITLNAQNYMMPTNALNLARFT